jgi:hypothetical protein
MSDHKPYITDDGGTLYLPYDLAGIMAAIDRTEQAPPSPPGYTLYPGQDPAVALADLVAGDTLWLADGVHPYPIHLPAAINVRALDAGYATVSGWTEPEWTPYHTPFGEPAIYRALYGRFGGRLTHRISNNAAFPAARQAVHNAAAAPDLVAYAGTPLTRYASRAALTAPGMWYDQKEGWLYVALPFNSDPALLQVAQYPQLLTAADGVNDVTVSGIRFDGAANTTKMGAVQVYGERWLLDSVTVSNVNSVGIMVGGIGHRFVDTFADDCGQMGWAGKSDGGVFESCGMRRSNWRGFDAGWEAGMKFSFSRGNVWTNWLAEDCDGPGFWLDISNYDNVLDGFRIINAMKAGAMLEHYAGGNEYRNGVIYGTRAWPVTGACAGLQVQANIVGNEFWDIEIGATQGGNSVLYKANEGTSRDKGSSKNRFVNITGDRPWRIQGALSGDDTFTNCTPSPI